MLDSAPGSPTCPSCKECLSAKSLAVTCGSCGHNIPLKRSCGGVLTTFGCVASFAVLLGVLGFIAHSESQQFRHEIRNNLEQKIFDARSQTRRLKSEVSWLQRELERTRDRNRDLQRVNSGLGDRLLDRELAGMQESRQPGLRLEPLETEIEFLIDRVGREPHDAEAHFRLAVALERAGGEDASARFLDHAQKAIRLDPGYKARLKPMILGSETARRIARIVHQVIRDGERGVVDDAAAAKYASEIAEILERRPACR